MPSLPFIPFADCAEIVLSGTYGGSNCVTTYAVQKPSPLSVPDLLAIFGVFDNWWQVDMRGGISVNYTLDFIKVTDLTTDSSPTTSAPPSANPAGAATGTSAPANSAMVITSLTALRGRSYRGRNYWPAIPSSSLYSAALITTTAQAANQAAYDALSTDLLAAGFTPVVLSRYHNSVRRTVGVPTPILSYVAKRRIGTIRKRILP